MRKVSKVLYASALGMASLLGCSSESTPAECSGGAVGAACEGGACLEGVCTPLVTVGGVVGLFDSLEDDTGAPIANVTVSVLGTAFSTTTDQDGEFSFEVFEGDWFVGTSKSDAWGWNEPMNVPADGRSDLVLTLLAETVATEFAGQLGVELDPNKGGVSVTFSGTSGGGGENATISESHDGPYAYDQSGLPVPSDGLLPGTENDLEFVNVMPTSELIVEPSGVAGVNRCELEDPEAVYPVVQKSWTVGIDVTCTAN